MLKVGIIGWRGMVGSVLIQRMHEENDFESIDAHFFSTSQSGGKVRILKSQESNLLDAFDVDELIKMDILLSCQGGDYTKKMLHPLREKNWSGHWVDAASTLRMNSDAMIVLDKYLFLQFLLLTNLNRPHWIPLTQFQHLKADLVLNLQKFDLIEVLEH
ncbi:hypothetical protein N9N95_01270 [Methylophilaceae bacterium]|nr:hypothetical protein [Methylophilaceae bacterium]